jgi:hypothetical protein
LFCESIGHDSDSVFLISIDTKQDKETDGDALIMKYTSVLKYDIIDFLLQF